MSVIQAARSLGFASLFVGATEIVATKWLQKQMGVSGHDLILRLFGAREIAAGVSILQQPGIQQPLANSLWARVAGDALDLAMLGAAAEETDSPEGLATVSAIVLAITGMDIIVASLVQANVQQAKAISTAAKGRVLPTQAMPTGRPAGTLITEAVQ